uniref:alpha-1,2-Mannosidase n=1 Tax=Meloidogyne incognita TaxID=6306 RepID=A0A914MF67_MELIC
MGLRFHEKYLLLIGSVSLGLFILSATLFYFSSSDLSSTLQNHKIRDVGNKRGNEEFLVRKAVVYRHNLSDNSALRQNNDYRRNYVKEMMKFAWDGYVAHAWGQNELNPITKSGHSGSIFGSAHLGATIVDAADTLYIMGLVKEFEKAKQWIDSSFDILTASSDLSVFETNIRYVGGLLSAYALTKEKLFLSKAIQIADLLLPAFDASSTGIPLALINVQTGKATNYGWASGGCSILSEFGSIELEFSFLSKITGNDTYLLKCRKLREYVNKLEKPDGLYSNYLNPNTGKWCQRHISVGALGDSFYEYLLKVWLFDEKRDKKLWETYKNAILAIEKKLLFKSKPSNLWYFAEMKGTRTEHKMDHLACFTAGMFALQSLHETDINQRAHYLELAEKIGETCHESYNRTITKLGPESFRFATDLEARAVRVHESYYILRPEAVEGWFYLWRVTGKQQYRDWCWEVVEALEKHCRATAGYTGIRNVNSLPVDQDDVQQSFFLAETLKYLFLTFSDSNKISLDKWVFNTEAHPFPIEI